MLSCFDQAMAVGHQLGLSTALFAPGWLFETLKPDEFLENDRKQVFFLKCHSALLNDEAIQVLEFSGALYKRTCATIEIVLYVFLRWVWRTILSSRSGE